MLRWRLILGVLLIAVLTALCWLDVRAERPGIWLLPLALPIGVLATQELLHLLGAKGLRPHAATVYVATMLPIVGACAPLLWPDSFLVGPVGRLGWIAAGVAAGLLWAIAGEMRRYTAPSNTLPNLAAAAISILYVGGLLGFMIQLRLLPVFGDLGKGGMLALLSMLMVVKLADIGAYTAGRLFGRHKFAPVLSPGKTWEGVAGGLLLALGGAYLALGPLTSRLGLVTDLSGARWWLAVGGYGILVSLAGIFGDLTESLLKRDAGVKDSSTWLPGFGGVLDLVDSLLVAAPVAYLCWASGLLGG